MAREQFRVVANDAHFNNSLVRFTEKGESADHLRELIRENAPHLTVVRVDPLASALYMELREARDNMRVLPEYDHNLYGVELERVCARREKILERLGSCCALAELLGVKAQENLITNLRRFDKTQNFAINGLDLCPFSFSFGWGNGFQLHGGLIFHFSSRTWSMHT